MTLATQFGTTYLFDAFTLDVSRRTLTAGPNAIGLSEKVFRVLLVLLEAGGAVVHKRKFLEEVWLDEPVAEATLTQQIFVLRGLLRPHATTPSIVLTVPGSGYRLGVIVDKKAGLVMKTTCERCGIGLPPSGLALICSYECTFCLPCGGSMNRQCPNCGGELTERPRRSTATA